MIEKKPDFEEIQDQMEEGKASVRERSVEDNERLTEGHKDGCKELKYTKRNDEARRCC